MCVRIWPREIIFVVFSFLTISCGHLISFVKLSGHVVLLMYVRLQMKTPPLCCFERVRERGLYVDTVGCFNFAVANFRDVFAFNAGYVYA